MNARDLNKTQSARNSKHVFTMLITQFEILQAFQIVFLILALIVIMVVSMVFYYYLID
jgi:hypothetical protein